MPLRFFSRLLGRPHAVQVLHLEAGGTFLQEVVGESRYQDALQRICGPRTRDGVEFTCEAVLTHEDDNPHDKHAVRVDVNDVVVGYLSRHDAVRFRKFLSKGGSPGARVFCPAVIRGGWDRGTRGQGHYGVRLDLPPFD